MVAVMRLPVGPHPHSHGENGMFTPLVYSFAGSSPLTRGKLDPQSDQRNAHGLIPAHAGKTRKWPRLTRSPVAHPRSRRENRPCDSHSAAIAGSSPLTRGKPSAAPLGDPQWRLIPAHAGKTAHCLGSGPATWAHPRSRGENEAHCLVPSGVYGSSPLTRGKQARL